MKYLDRVLLLMHAFGTAVAALLLLLLAAGWSIPLEYLRTSSSYLYGRMLLASLAALSLAASLRLLYVSTSRGGGKQTVVHETPLGQVRVSLHAVENLVKKVVRQVKGVREVKAYVAGSEQSGVSVQLRAVVSPEVNIPSVATEIQQTVREYILDVVGISVASVKVFVENISADAKTRLE